MNCVRFGGLKTRDPRGRVVKAPGFNGSSLLDMRFAGSNPAEGTLFKHLSHINRNNLRQNKYVS